MKAASRNGLQPMIWVNQNMGKKLSLRLHFVTLYAGVLKEYYACSALYGCEDATPANKSQPSPPRCSLYLDYLRYKHNYC